LGYAPKRVIRGTLKAARDLPIELSCPGFREFVAAPQQ
jgi:hypothetical protein